MIKAVIFDFWGVICTDAYTAWQHQYVPDYEERVGQFNDISRRSDLGMLPLQDFYAELSTITGTDWQTVRDQLGESMKIDHAILEIMKTLRARNIKIGLLSNSPNSLYDTIDGFGIRSEFDTILTSQEAGALKPDARIFEMITNKLRVLPAEAVFIDDAAYNAEGASRANLIGITYHTPNQLIAELTRLEVF